MKLSAKPDSELISRNRGGVRYPADMPLEEIEKIIKQRLNQAG